MNDKEAKNKRMKLLIRTAKEAVESAHGPRTYPEWVECSPHDSYGNPEYKISISVYTGSPVKGCVLSDWCSGICKAYGPQMRLIRTFKLKEVVCI